MYETIQISFIGQPHGTLETQNDSVHLAMKLIVFMCVTSVWLTIQAKVQKKKKKSWVLDLL